MNNPYDNPFANPMSYAQAQQKQPSLDPLQQQAIKAAQERDAALRQLAIEIYLTQLRKNENSWKIDDCYKIAAGLIAFDITKLNDPNF